MKHNIIYSDRLFDPINYKEACYYIAQEKMGRGQKNYLRDMDFHDLLIWLGSNCGQWFLREADELIEEYPYKDDCAAAIVCGKVVNADVVKLHEKWIKNKLKS